MEVRRLVVAVCTAIPKNRLISGMRETFSLAGRARPANGSRRCVSDLDRIRDAGIRGIWVRTCAALVVCPEAPESAWSPESVEATPWRIPETVGLDSGEHYGNTLPRPVPSGSPPASRIGKGRPLVATWVGTGHGERESCNSRASGGQRSGSGGDGATARRGVSVRAHLSVARADAGPDSDYDLMVVAPDDADPERQRSRSGHRAVRHLGAAPDIFVSKASDFRRQLHLKASLPSTVVRAGILLYLWPMLPSW